MRKSNAIIKVNIDNDLWSFTEVPDSLSMMTGFSIKELTDKFDNCFLNLLPYDESIFIKEEILEQLSTERYAEIDFILPCADNFKMWVHIQAEHVHADGNALEIWLSNTTQFHESTDELLNRLVDFEETLQGGVWCANCDSDLSIIWCNEKYNNIIGIETNNNPNSTTTQNKAIQQVYADDASQVIEIINNAINNNQTDFLMEYRMVRADSQIISVFTSVKLRFSHGSSMPTIYCITYDISNLNHVKDAQRLVSLYKFIIQKNATCILEYDIVSKNISGTNGLSKLFNSYDNFPESAINSNNIADNCIEKFRNIFDPNSGTSLTEPTCIHIISQTGDSFWLNVTRSIVCDANNLPIKIIAHMEDISIKYNKELTFLEAKYHVPSPSYNGMFSCSINLTKDYVLQVSAEFYNQFGFAPTQSFSAMLNEIVTHNTNFDDRATVLKAFNKYEIIKNIEKGVFSSEIEVREKHGNNEYQWIRISLNYINDPESNDLLIYVHTKDINQKKENELALKLQAERDSLTQLYNRITFESKVDRIILSDKSISHALFMMDLDNFKFINDTYGHAYGDSILIEVSQKLNDIFSAPHLVGRIGGDEFTALAYNVTQVEATQIAQQICSTLQSALLDTCVVSASIGISFAPNDGEQFNSLYHCADMALYEAKRKGKNCYSIYSKSMHNNTHEEKVSISREWLLDVSSDMVYVVDFYTYDLLYMNSGARELFKTNDDYRGKKCYEVLQHRERPCEFCTNKYLSRDSFYRWEHYNEVLNRYLWLKDRIVDWYGVSARIEFATDVTEQQMATRALEKKINIDNILVKSLREMSNTHTIDVVSERLLEYVGTFYHADRICVYEYNNDSDCAEMKKEWVNIDIKPVLSVSSSVPISVFAPMQKSFFNDKNYILKDVSTISKSHPELYSLLKSHDTDEIHAVPFLLSNRNSGVVTLENPRDFVNDLSTLETLAFFISEQKVKTQLSNRIIYLQEHDLLTNMPNRAKYYEYKSDLVWRELTSLGIIIINIKNLKAINTKLGYNHGDRLVCLVADNINKSFPSQGRYRLDGDEFIVVAENLSYDKFQEYISKFKLLTSASSDVALSIGQSWTGVHVSIDDLYNLAYESITAQ